MKRTGGTLIDVDAANWKITSRRQGSNWCRRAKSCIFYIVIVCPAIVNTGVPDIDVFICGLIGQFPVFNRCTARIEYGYIGYVALVPLGYDLILNSEIFSCIGCSLLICFCIAGCFVEWLAYPRQHHSHKQ